MLTIFSKTAHWQMEYKRVNKWENVSFLDFFRTKKDAERYQQELEQEKVGYCDFVISKYDRYAM